MTRALGFLLVLAGSAVVIFNLSSDVLGWSDSPTIGTYQKALIAAAGVIAVAGLLMMTLLRSRADRLLSRVLPSPEIRRTGRRALLLLDAVLLTAFLAFYLLPGPYRTLRVASGFAQPTFALPIPGTADDWYVLERAGQIRMLIDGEVSDEIYLDLHEQTLTGPFELGLLGMVLDPAYDQNHVFYVYYTDKSERNFLMRYRAGDDPTQPVDADSGVLVLDIPELSDHHAGGALAFGPDGYLYVSVGDGGKDFSENAQDLTNLMGSILRIDVDSTAESPPYYTIPPDNPFVDAEDARPEIWVYGLRNPWRFTIDADRDRLIIADVGLHAFEEISVTAFRESGGLNFGWPWYEGDERHLEYPGSPPEGLQFPVHTYTRDAETGCAIIGGFVYGGSAFPALRGKYLFSDFCGAGLHALSQDSAGDWVVEDLFDSNVGISSLAEYPDGEVGLLYYNGEFHRMSRYSWLRVWLNREQF